MQQLYSAKDGLEAHDLRLFLEAHGIVAKVLGDSSGLEAGFSFTPASAPSVYVQDVDLIRAADLVREFHNQSSSQITRPKWTCRNCGQSVDGQFDACWNCEAPRSESGIEIDVAETEPTTADLLGPEEEGVLEPTQSIASETIPNQSVRKSDDYETWFELAVVLAVSWLPAFLAGFFPNVHVTGGSFIIDTIWSIVNYIPTVLVVLYVMHHSGMPWARFGLKRIRIFFDAFAGTIIWLAIVGISFVIYRFFDAIDERGNVWDFGRSTFEGHIPATRLDFALLLPYSLVIGFSEELAMRAYLIPRLKPLLGSATKSVIVAAFLFATCHLYQGLGSTLNAFIIGLALGIAFCFLRRLWPVAFAHALWDIYALAVLGGAGAN